MEPLLSGDSVNSDFSVQRLGKHVPIVSQQVLNNATVGRNNGKIVFSMWSVPRCYKQETK
jgi:hypothetical protein